MGQDFLCNVEKPLFSLASLLKRICTKKIIYSKNFYFCCNSKTFFIGHKLINKWHSYQRKLGWLNFLVSIEKTLFIRVFLLKLMVFNLKQCII